jgi:hypothetical protein
VLGSRLSTLYRLFEQIVGGIKGHPVTFGGLLGQKPLRFLPGIGDADCWILADVGAKAVTPADHEPGFAMFAESVLMRRASRASLLSLRTSHSQITNTDHPAFLSAVVCLASRARFPSILDDQ